MKKIKLLTYILLRFNIHFAKDFRKFMSAACGDCATCTVTVHIAYYVQLRIMFNRCKSTYYEGASAYHHQMSAICA